MGTGDEGEPLLNSLPSISKKEELVVLFSLTTNSLYEETRYEQSISNIYPPYTAADLRYTNPLARCNREKIGRKDVPVKGKVENWDSFDTVYIGFPIWYYGAPNVVNTFCKGYSWSGKRVYIFATSGGSGIGKTAEKLEPYLKGAKIVDAKRVDSAGELATWTL